MKKMDAEEVVAFVNEAVPYSKRGVEGKREWCRRVKKVLGNGWSQRRLSDLLGVAQSVISERLAWSERPTKTDADRARRSKRDNVARARKIMRDLDVSPEVKADLVAQGQSDPQVQQVLQRRLREKGGAPSVQPAPKRADTRFHDGIMRATDGLDIALAAAKDKAIPEGAEELVAEVADRVARLERAVGTEPGTSTRLRRVK